MKRIGFQSALIESVLKLLLEGRKENAIKKYPELSPVIDRFVENDPSNNLKYLDWQVKLASQGADPSQLINIVKLFDVYGKKLENKDINYWTLMKLDRLETELSGIAARASEKTAKQEAVRCDQKIIFENNDFLVRQIMSKDASAHYGRGTKWCITMADRTHFEDYSMNNVLFFFVFRKKTIGDDNDKIAISVQRDENNKVIKTEFWDSTDYQISESDVEEIWGPAKKQIMSTVYSVCETYKQSPIAAFFSGKISSDEAIKVYFDEMNKGKGIFSQAAEAFVLRTLKSKRAYPSKIINDIAERAMLEPYVGSEKLHVLELVSSHINLSPQVKKKLFYVNFESRKEKREFLQYLFDEESEAPSELIDSIIATIQKNPDHVDDLELSITNAPNLTRIQEIELIYAVDKSKAFTTVCNKLLNRKKLDPTTIDFMADRLVSLHKSSFRQGVSPDNVTETYYTMLLKKMVYRSDLTDHAKQVIKTIPLMREFFEESDQETEQGERVVVNFDKDNLTITVPHSKTFNLPNGKTFVAEDYETSELRAKIDQQNKELVITNIYVPEARRGKGVAKKLISAATQFATKKQLKVYTSGVYSDDGKALVQSYTNKGIASFDQGKNRHAIATEAQHLLQQTITEIIKKCGDKYCLYTKHKKNGKRRKLGTHSSKASAERQERAIHAHKG